MISTVIKGESHVHVHSFKHKQSHQIRYHHVSQNGNSWGLTSFCLCANITLYHMFEISGYNIIFFLSHIWHSNSLYPGKFKMKRHAIFESAQYHWQPGTLRRLSEQSSRQGQHSDRSHTVNPIWMTIRSLQNLGCRNPHLLWCKLWSFLYLCFKSG